VTREEFRDAIQNIYYSLRHGGYIPEYGDFDPGADYLYYFIDINFAEDERLLEHTPGDPPELKMIAQEIYRLPMIRKIIAPSPSDAKIDQTDYDRDKPILESKLQEMLTHLAPPANAPSRNAGVPPTRRTRRRVRRARPKKNLTPSERRAATVAKVIEELDILKPHMTGSDSDYDQLARKNNRSITFRVARQHEDLKLKVQNLQDHRRHIRLAQELVARKTGRELGTIQMDWKKHKPVKYRQRNK